MPDAPLPQQLPFIDSHTCGEPTRVIPGGWPVPEGIPIRDLPADLRANLDHLRKAICTEPRATPAMVGAYVIPGEPLGVVFFNNTGYLGMCGHGTIGLVASLPDRFPHGVLTPLQTPAGEVQVLHHADGRVTIRNVPARVCRTEITLQTAAGEFIGDVVWGGNWFFMIDSQEELSLARVSELTQITQTIMDALEEHGLTGENGAKIDHVELVQPIPGQAHAYRNFVLCPGGEYDRSPCGTGTSAKLALLAHRQALQPGQKITIFGITGEPFEGEYSVEQDQIIPHITSKAHVTGRGELIFDPNDPFQWGI